MSCSAWVSCLRLFKTALRGLGLRVQGSGFRVSGLGFRGLGVYLGFRGIQRISLEVSLRLPITLQVAIPYPDSIDGSFVSLRPLEAGRKHI